VLQARHAHGNVELGASEREVVFTNIFESSLGLRDEETHRFSHQ